MAENKVRPKKTGLLSSSLFHIEYYYFLAYYNIVVNIIFPAIEKPEVVNNFITDFFEKLYKPKKSKDQKGIFNEQRDHKIILLFS